MEPAGSTLLGHAERGVGPRATARGPVAPADAALLLPMVRRAVRTARGPAALVSWLRRRAGPAPAGDAAERALAAGLARRLFGSCACPGDTLDDSRARILPAPAAGST